MTSLKEKLIFSLTARINKNEKIFLEIHIHIVIINVLYKHFTILLPRKKKCKMYSQEKRYLSFTI